MISLYKVHSSEESLCPGNIDLREELREIGVAESIVFLLINNLLKVIDTV